MDNPKIVSIEFQKVIEHEVRYANPPGATIEQTRTFLIGVDDTGKKWSWYTLTIIRVFKGIEVIEYSEEYDFREVESYE